MASVLSYRLHASQSWRQADPRVRRVHTSMKLRTVQGTKGPCLRIGAKLAFLRQRLLYVTPNLGDQASVSTEPLYCGVSTVCGIAPLTMPTPAHLTQTQSKSAIT